MAPRRLSAEEQAFSDRAVAAANAATHETRGYAWLVVGRLGGRLAAPEATAVENRLEMACLYGAVLMLVHNNSGLDDAAVLSAARRLRDIHHRHMDIMAERVRAD